MPLAMIAGGLLHDFVGRLDFLLPWLLFFMLFIPFCGVRMGDLRVTGLSLHLLLFQAVASIFVYAVAGLFDDVVAQGAMICVLAPTASSAVVVATMLGARASTVLSYSLVINTALAMGAPLFFTVIAPSVDVSFWGSVWAIFVRVIPVVVLPFVGALVVRWLWPRGADFVRQRGSLSFYLWIVALVVVTGRVVGFIVDTATVTVGEGLILAGVGLVVCLFQFFVGRHIGGRYGQRIAGGQLLGQKNTILAIWLTQTYLNPASSIVPAAYILWQTIFNSFQLWRKGVES